MHHLHGLLPGRAGESALSRPQAGRSRRRTAPSQGSIFLQPGAQVLPELQALRSRVPIRRESGGHHPVCPHQVRPRAAQAPRRHACEHGLHGQARPSVRAHRERNHRPRCHQDRPGRDIRHRQAPHLPEIQRSQLRRLAQAPRQGTGEVRQAGRLLPRLLRELQLPPAGQGLREGDERRPRRTPRTTSPSSRRQSMPDSRSSPPPPPA